MGWVTYTWYYNTIIQSKLLKKSVDMAKSSSKIIDQLADYHYINDTVIYTERCSLWKNIIKFEVH